MPVDRATLVEWVGGGQPPGRATWTDNPGANESKPINLVHWYLAFAFCIWDGGRLPTESEWEYAAAGGAENRLYPWGSAAPDCSYANFAPAALGPYCGPGGAMAVAPVGSYPAGNGKWGHADLAGNVWQWVVDWYAAYPARATSDYADTAPTELRVIRGGAWDFGVTELRSAYRYNADDWYDPLWNIGFRCARSPQ